MKSTTVKFLWLSTLVSLLFGCSTTPSTLERGGGDFVTINGTEAAGENTVLSSVQALEKAQSTLPTLSDLELARLISYIDTADLNFQQEVDLRIIKLEVSIRSNDSNSIQQELSDFPVAEALRTSLSRQESIVRALANSYSKIDRPLDAAVLIADYEGVFGSMQAPFLSQEIWLLLQRTQTEVLTQYTYTGGNPNTDAWLSLARSLKINQSSIDEQYAQLIDWRSNHPNHAATLHPPLELELLAELPNTAPQQIVLALPLSGPLMNIGQAVLDGFLANYYTQNNRSDLSIKAFDTNTRALEDLYSTQALQSSKTLVVGPITKQNIDTLSSLTPLSIKTLALNTSDTTPHQENLFVFGLDPLQEARQISNKISQNQLNRVAVIHSDSPRHKALMGEFVAQITSQGGRIVSSATYGKDKPVSKAVAELLATTTSKERSHAVQRITGLRLEKKPERRQDIDAIIVLSDHKTGKQIKPLLAFNFAKDIPVYANSSIHLPDIEDSNNDLSGVQFIDIPWVFAKTNHLRAQVETLRSNNAARYSRFYALGADAYTLAPRISIMRELPNSHVQGLTGTLGITPDGTVSRELDWATYRRGRAVHNSN